MDILKEHIVVLEKDQLTTHQSELTAFFMKALDFRAEHSQVVYENFVEQALFYKFFA